MALSSTGDYQVLVNKILYYMEKNFGGIDLFGFPVFAKIEPADFQTMMDAYMKWNRDVNGHETAGTGYRMTREARPTASELYPTAHGTSETETFSQGH